MDTAKKFEIIKNLRLATVIGAGAVGILTTSFLVASGLRNAVNSQGTLSDLTAILLGCTALGLLVTALFCMLIFHAFSFFESTTLPRAIRLNEAMRMLHSKTNRESLNTLKYFGISVFKAKTALSDGVEENVPCKLISTFLSPWFFRSDRNAAFGSDNHCCDFTQIQRVIAENEAKWGHPQEELPGDTPVEVTALQLKIANLLEEKKKANLKFAAASGREGLLKTQLAEVESHIAVLVELVSKVSTEGKSTDKITKDSFRAKYLAIGKIYGITKVPGAYMEIFRKNMPKDKINWGGAPTQSPDDEQT